MTELPETPKQEIVGLSEIATLLEVATRTPHVWKYRKLLPKADFSKINCSQAWYRSTIILWAKENGRLPESLLEETQNLIEKNS